MTTYRGNASTLVRRRAKNGTDGRGILSVTRWYYLSTSKTSLTGGTWSTTSPTRTAGTWIWTKEITAYSDGTTDETEAVCTTGDKGDKGDTGASGTNAPETQNRGFYVSTATYVYTDTLRDSILYKEASWSDYYRFRVRTKGASLTGVPPTSTSGDANWEAANQLSFIASDLAFITETIVDKLITRILKTAASGARIEAEGSIMKVFGTSNVANIVFGVNSDGLAVLTYYNNQGVKLYDLGPDGITRVQVRERKMTKINIVIVSTTENGIFTAFTEATENAFPKAITTMNGSVYQYTAQMVAGVINSVQAPYDGKFYDSNSMDSTTGVPTGNEITAGWYAYYPDSGTDYGNVEAVSYNNTILSSSDVSDYDSRNEIVMKRPYVKSRVVYEYGLGVLSGNTKTAYWNASSN